MNKQKINISTIKWLVRIAATAKGSLFFLFLIKILQGIVGIVFAFFLRTVIDAAVSGNEHDFYLYLALGSGIIVAEVVLYWLATYYKEKPAAVLARNIRHATFEQLLKRSYPDISKVHTGEWMTRINSDGVIIANAITSLIPGTAGLIVQMVCALAAMFLLLPRMAWILIPLGAGMIMISLFMRIRLKNYHKNVQRNEGISYSYLQESLGSMSIIRTYVREEQTGLEAYQKLDGVVKAKLRRARFISCCSSAVYALIRVSYFLGVAVCSFRLLKNVMTYGMMAAVLQLIRQADLPLAEVTSAVPKFFNMIASAERLIEIEKLDLDYTDEPVAPDEARRFYEEELCEIGFNKVHFSYNHDAPFVLPHGLCVIFCCKLVDKCFQLFHCLRFPCRLTVTKMNQCRNRRSIGKGQYSRIASFDDSLLHHPGKDFCKHRFCSVEKIVVCQITDPFIVKLLRQQEFSALNDSFIVNGKIHHFHRKPLQLLHAVRYGRHSTGRTHIFFIVGSHHFHNCIKSFFFTGKMPVKSRLYNSYRIGNVLDIRCRITVFCKKLK